MRRKLPERIIAKAARDVTLVTIIQNVISVDKRARANGFYPDSFFFSLSIKSGRPTMRDQRAQIVAATDRGIDLTLERNAWLAGCYFAFMY